MEKQTTIIEINGVKMEIDLRSAKRIDELRVGSRVKCLVKKYNDFATYPGVIIGFEPFQQLPSIVVAYLDVDYSASNIVFKTFNAETKDFEIVSDLDNNPIEVNKPSVLSKFQREIDKKQSEIDELVAKRDYFIEKFGEFFVDFKAVQPA